MTGIDRNWTSTVNFLHDERLNLANFYTLRLNLLPFYGSPKGDLFHDVKTAIRRMREDNFTIEQQSVNQVKAWYNMRNTESHENTEDWA